VPPKRSAPRPTSLDTRLDALDVRVRALEARAPRQSHLDPASDAPATAAAPELAVLALLEQRGESPAATAGVSGRLLIGGQVQAGARRYADVRFQEVADALRADAGALSHLLGAIASAPRLTILRRLITADSTRSDLLAALKGTSAGQLYHHVRALESAGLVMQPSRGVFRIRPERVVPLISLLSVARLLTPAPTD
jgi:ArsR family transcriptional regulator, arsenate/arsenite/antimonite-responsive transcriptional repressor